TLARADKQVQGNFDKAGAIRTSGATGLGGAGRATPGSAAAAPSDAGVPLYNAASNISNLQDRVNSDLKREKEAKETIAKKDAPQAEKEKAQQELDRIDGNRKLNDQAQAAVAKSLNDKRFVAGFGNNGGEEFLSFMNISETLLAKGGAEWEKWDKQMAE